MLLHMSAPMSADVDAMSDDEAFGYLKRCFGFPLCLIESECEVGAAGVCSVLAVFRDVSEEWDSWL